MAMAMTTVARSTAARMTHRPLDAAAALKQLRALAASEQQLCNISRGRMEAALEGLLSASRRLRNYLHMLHRTATELLPIDDAAAAVVRLPVSLGLCPDPSVPPAKLRAFLGPYASLLTVLRRQPALLIEAVHRSGAAPALALPLLLNFVWGHVWRWDEERAIIIAAAHAVGLRVVEAGPALSLRHGLLPEQLCSAYLRMMPGGADWLQAALSVELAAIADDSERGLSLLTSSGGCAQRCAAILHAVVAAAAAVPRGLHALCWAVLVRGTDAASLSPPPYDADASQAAVSRSAAAAAAVSGAESGQSLESGQAEAAAAAVVRELLVALWIAPAVACPEAYGILLPTPIGRDARRNLLHVAAMLTAAVVTPPDLTAPSAPDPAPAAALEYASAAGRGPSQQDPLATLAARCVAAVLGSRGVAPADSPQFRASDSASITLVAPNHAVDRVAPLEPEAATPPPLDVEIPLCSLRALHTICAEQATWLVASARDEPLLRPLLSSLEVCAVPWRRCWA